MHFREGMKYLGGGALVYLAMAACAGQHENRGSLTDALVAPGTSGGPVPDANALEAKQGGGTQRVVTADSDPAQQRGGGVLASTTAQTLAAGPLYLTDARAVGQDFNNSTITIYTVAGSDCAASRKLEVSLNVASGGLPRGDLNPVHGARYFVPNGDTVCTVTNGSATQLAWAGFAPY